MIPVASLDDVCIHWVEIRTHGFKLYGFLLYTISDQYLPEYIGDDGLTDLDIWTGKDCGIFLLHDPPPEWLAYAKANEHIWWTTFGQSLESNIVNAALDLPLVELGGGERTTARALMPALTNKGLAKQQVAMILAHFELAPTAHPSLVFFRDIQDRDIWVVGLDDLLGLPKSELRVSLKKWFAGPEFAKLMKG